MSYYGLIKTITSHTLCLGEYAMNLDLIGIFHLMDKFTYPLE
jgi:hypothetical protein